MPKHIEFAELSAEDIGPGWQQITITDTAAGRVALTADVSVDDLRALVAAWIQDGNL